MKNKSYWWMYTLVIVLFILVTSACYKQVANNTLDFTFGDSIVSIQRFRKLHNMGMVEMIGQPFVIEGVVVANDEHDNFYKSICIQDKTGGIMVQMDGLSLYQNFPIGAMVRINTQHLFLSDYRHMVQLVASVDTSSGSLVTSGIPAPLFNKFIKIVSDNAPIVPLIVAYKNLADSLQGRLIQINAVEFSAVDTAQTYADNKNKIGMSRSLKFCTGGTIYLRTSGYADFAGIKTQSGNGIVQGIYSVFNTEKQIMLRDTNDILLTGKRCTGAAWLQNLHLTAAKGPN